MRFRYLLLIFVVVFGATLAVIVGETLSAEAMAVMVGVVAGVAASIPASLLILWVALRTAELRAAPVVPSPMMYAAAPAEPRIVVVTQPAPRPAASQGYEGSPAYPFEQPAELLPAPARPARRRFVVVDGRQAVQPDGFVMGEPQYEEVAWER
jgi:hypothetical protein